MDIVIGLAILSIIPLMIAATAYAETPQVRAATWQRETEKHDAACQGFANKLNGLAYFTGTYNDQAQLQVDANLLAACGFRLARTAPGATYSRSSCSSSGYRHGYGRTVATSYAYTQTLGIYEREPGAGHVRITAEDPSTILVSVSRAGRSEPDVRRLYNIHVGGYRPPRGLRKA